MTIGLQTLDRMSKDFTPMQDLEDREMTTTDFPGRWLARFINCALHARQYMTEQNVV